MISSKWLSIGQLADRTGLSVSAIRFYETKGLISPGRNTGGQRRFQRADIRRLSFVLIAQQFGFTSTRSKKDYSLFQMSEHRTRLIGPVSVLDFVQTLMQELKH